jgi:hypothetical protein
MSTSQFTISGFQGTNNTPKERVFKESYVTYAYKKYHEDNDELFC